MTEISIDGLLSTIGRLHVTVDLQAAELTKFKVLKAEIEKIEKSGETEVAKVIATIKNLL